MHTIYPRNPGYFGAWTLRGTFKPALSQAQSAMHLGFSEKPRNLEFRGGLGFRSLGFRV